MLRSTIILLTLLVLASVSACGGDDDYAPAATTPPTAEPTSRVTSTPAPTPTATPTTTPTPPPSPAPIPTSTATPTPTPTPSPTPDGYYDPHDPCGPSRELVREAGIHRGFLHWTPDASQLIFDFDDTILVLDADGRNYRKLVDIAPDYETGSYSFYRFLYEFYADLSPDGSEIVYSTCEYTLSPPVPDAYGFDFRYSEGYELNIINLDGTGKRRLTENDNLENFPTWSPDGTRIAFVEKRGPGLEAAYYSPGSGTEYMKLITKIIDTPASRLNLSTSVRTTGGLKMFPPLWSPDGQHLAFMTLEELEEDEWRLEDHVPKWYNSVLHTIRSDGTNLTRIGETIGVPTWSPDGQRLAFVSDDEKEPAIYSVRPDGTDQRLILGGSSRHSPFTTVHELQWSPDGAEILFIDYGGVHTVPHDGGDTCTLMDETLESARIELGDEWPWVRETRAAWSPDGSTIALRERVHREGMILTISRDGSNARILLVTYEDEAVLPPYDPFFEELTHIPPSDHNPCSDSVETTEPLPSS